MAALWPGRLEVHIAEEKMRLEPADLYEALPVGSLALKSIEPEQNTMPGQQIEKEEWDDTVR